MTARPDIAIISGVGQTEYSKASGRSELRLGLEAILEACRDADLDPTDVDGFVGYPFSVAAEDIVSNLGLKRLRFSCEVHMGGASAVASLQHARVAIEQGIARAVVIVRARNGYSGPRQHARPSHLPAQSFRRQLEHPYAWNVAAQRYALICRRYMIEYGLTRQELGAVALTMREHAQRNPNAMTFGRTLTMEQYLTGRVIADPYTLFDCCLETDGACAVVVTSADHAVSGRGHARIRAVAEGRPDSPDDLTNRLDLLTIGLHRAAPVAWEAAGAGPQDMDAAMIYDCFTFELIHQLEAAGFVETGQAGKFIGSGAIALGGRLPVNTHGGLMSEGHLGGLNHVIEAVRQLRHQCAGRQVDNARLIAVTGWGDLGDGSLAVLERMEA